MHVAHNCFFCVSGVVCGTKCRRVALTNTPSPAQRIIYTYKKTCIHYKGWKDFHFLSHWMGAYFEAVGLRVRSSVFKVKRHKKEPSSCAVVSGNESLWLLLILCRCSFTLWGNKTLLQLYQDLARFRALPNMSTGNVSQQQIETSATVTEGMMQYRYSLYRKYYAYLFIERRRKFRINRIYIYIYIYI